MADAKQSLWYALHGRRAVEQIPVIAATGPSGNCCIMCAVCGHVFVDGAPFTSESEQIGNATLAAALYYHACSDEGTHRNNKTRETR